MGNFLDSTGLTKLITLVKNAIGSKAPSVHSHGNIQSGGTLLTNDVAIANGDKLVITDASDSSKVARASAAFDGSTISKALTQKGTFENIVSTSTNGLKIELVASMPSSASSDTIYIVQ